MTGKEMEILVLLLVAIVMLVRNAHLEDKVRRLTSQIAASKYRDQVLRDVWKA